MLSRALDTLEHLRPDRRFWIVSALVIGTLLLAFWLVCSHQVRRSETRELAQRVEVMAFDDCLRYVEHSTIGTCIARLGMNQP